MNSKKEITHGSLVISLDFEMMWGNMEKYTVDGYGRTNVAQVPKVVDRMLVLFEKYGIHATFATVGMMFNNGKSDALSNLPQEIPQYVNQNLSPYSSEGINCISKKDEALYFCPKIILKIKDTPGMEVGSHTYCHYFCWEKGQSIKEFVSDLNLNKKVFLNHGLEIHSIVFPRNQVKDEYLKECASSGIVCYRGLGRKYFKVTRTKFSTIKQRLCRLIDSYFNISGFSSVKYDSLEKTEGMINIISCRAFRPYSRWFGLIDFLRVRRVKKEILYAAQHNEMYHIWWHPHNLGKDMDVNLKALEEILQCYEVCHKKYGMQSYTMHEMSQLLIEKSIL